MACKNCGKSRMNRGGKKTKAEMAEDLRNNRTVPIRTGRGRSEVEKITKTGK